jgi:Ca-activated chloride channel family protein
MYDFLPFARPWMLLLLIVPVLLCVWVWRRETARIALPFDHSDYRGGRYWQFFINVGDCLPAMILAAVIMILAGPQTLSEPKTRRALTNIEFCVDVSGSMNAQFGDGNRYDASMQAINAFLDYREGDAFGLTFFGNEVLKWVPLTADVSAFRCAPPFMNPKNPGHPPWLGGTSIGKALLFCRQELIEREEGDRMIILVSDGFSSDLSDGGDEVAKQLAEDNISVFAIHIGGSSLPDAIVNITSRTNGEVFETDDPSTMVGVFGKIDSMQQTKLEKTSAETLDHFFPWCVAGLSFFGLGMCSLFGLRYTPW